MWGQGAQPLALPGAVPKGASGARQGTWEGYGPFVPGLHGCARGGGGFWAAFVYLKQQINVCGTLINVGYALHFSLSC